MYENIVKDAQEIKRRLAFIGQNDIDEAVVCDLLNSYGPDCALDSVMDIILSASNNNNPNFQDKLTNSENSGQSTAKCELADTTFKKENINMETSVEANSYIDECPIVLDDSSDTDNDDDDAYYNSSNWEDISYTDDISSQSPLPIMISACDDSDMTTQNINESAPITISDILEENNNDPNNNLDSIQILQEGSNYDPPVEVQSQTHEEETPTSPQPGCSKDTHIEQYINHSTLRDEAQKICNLLPKLQYASVYNSLVKYSQAENRVELTIFDLLQDTRPVPKYTSKRKHGDDDIIEVVQVSPDRSKFKTKPPVNYSCRSKLYDPSFRPHQKRDLQILCNPFNSTSTKMMWNPQNTSKSNLAIWNPPAKSSFQSNKPNASTIAPTSIFCKNTPSTSKDNILKQPVLNVTSNHHPVGKTSNCIQKQPTHGILVNPIRNHIAPANTKSVLIRPARLITNTTQAQCVNKITSSATVTSNSKTSLDDTNMRIVNEEGVQLKEPEQIGLGPIVTSSSMMSDTNNAVCHIVPIGTVKQKTEDSPPHVVPNSIPNPNMFLSYSDSKNIPTEASHSLSSTTVSTTSVPGSSNAKVEPATSTAIIPEQVNDNYILSSEAKSNEINSDEVSSCGEFHTPEGFNVIQKMEKSLHTRLLRVYSNLVSIFPQIDKKYIKQLCISNFEKEKQMHDLQRISDLTELLLKKEEEDSKKNQVPDETAINEQYANLLGIFPDADPTYLNKTAKELYNQPDELRTFIQTKLESRDYPTREQYYARQKITEQQKQYTTEFNIQKFLEIFPDPFAYFEDVNRKCQFNPDAFEFLKFHFNRIKVATLMSYYNQNKHHLSLTAKAVEQLRPDVKHKRIRAPYTPENIPLLQEIAFIVHKDEIARYLTELKQKELTEFLDLKRSNGLLQCQCCYDDECMPSKCSNCENGHVFCNSCIIRGTEAKLANGETRISCFTECQSEISLSVLQRTLPPTKFSIILKKRQEEEVMAAGLEGLVSCPFCYFASIPPPEDKIFKCLNPECMKETCRLCKELNHVPLKCDEAKCDKARLYLEEKMTEALVRTCYRCGRPFFKEDGCNKIYCVCGAMMCYICDKPIKGYDHFNQSGPSNRSNLCPLWSDNRRINAAAVVKVAEETVKQIHQKDPNVKLSTTGLLPLVPPTNPSSAGDNATVLPVRAHKVARLDS